MAMCNILTEVSKMSVLNQKWVKNVTDRQIDKFFVTIYGECGFFLQVKFATSLLALLAGDNQIPSK